ncbi:MAG: 3-mercaptopyruvate sulfurtransferase [Sphingomonadaceae bacterium]|nr:3-mercaptopyruvate sulfurtransferase [Sphingomonadaceae bacterium]
MDLLVSTSWLEAELGAPDLRVIDATLFLPGSGRDARAEYAAAHIPGAVFFDIHEIADETSALPHMLPSEHKFASRMQSLGLGDGNRFVVYDNSPLHSAARAWWMLKSFGAHYVALLDGGLQKWRAEGRQLSGAPEHHRHGHFTAFLDRNAVVDKAQVRALVEAGGGGTEIVDARPATRFAGGEAEPRAGLEAGHIPGARNAPQSEFFNADNSWKLGDELRAVFDAAGVDLGKPMVTSCGSGVTAAVPLFGARLLGKTDVRLYDGSWTEWGADPETPKAKGAA